MLFSAFEKHQYYNLKDLVDITKQPVVCMCLCWFLSIPYFLHISLVRRSIIKFASPLLMTVYVDTQKTSLNAAMSFEHPLGYFRFTIHLRAIEMAHSVKTFIRMIDDLWNPFWKERAPS